MLDNLKKQPPKKAKIRNILILSFLILPLLSSCASMNLRKSTIDPLYLNPMKNIAVMTIYCDERLDTSAMSSLVFSINKMSSAKNFNLSPMATKLHKTVFTLYPTILPGNIIDEKQIITTPQYQAIKKNENFFLKPSLVATPQGYIAISTFDLNPVQTFLESKPEIDGVLFLSADYKLIKCPGEFLGFGSLKVNCRITLSILDRQGNVALNHFVDIQSMSKVKYSMGGAFNTAELIPLCLEATDQADLWMQYWLKKNIKK